MCESKELIVGYLYDELSAADRAVFERHLAACDDCRMEVGGLSSTRAHLALWSPPEPDLGFRVIRGGLAPAPAVPRRVRLAPAFAFAAAAAIVLAVAAAIANIEVRYGNDGVTVRTGWARGQAQADGRPAESRPPQAPEVSAVPAAASASDSRDFAEIDRRLREIESFMAGQPSGSVQVSSDARMSDAEMLRRVRQIVGEAEARQETAVARRLLQVMRDFDQQRRTDIALIQQGLDQYQGMTNAEIAQNRDMFNQLVRAATRQEK